jgi:hypothetical protein
MAKATKTPVPAQDGQHDKMQLTPKEVSELDQMEAGLREGRTADEPSYKRPSEPIYDEDANPERSKEYNLAQREKDAVNKAEEQDKSTAPEGINEQEKAGDSSFYKPDSDKRQGFLKRYKGKHRKGKPRILPAQGIKRGLVIGGAGILGTVLFMGIVAWLLILVAPYKNVHFADILRSVGFARFTYQMNRQWSRVILDAATLTNNSTGKFPQGSLVNRIPGVNPERQLAQLGRQGVIRWDFAEEGARWRGYFRGENIYRGVEVNGQRIDLNEQSQELFGRNYNDLAAGQRMVVNARHANAYRAAIGEALATLPRSQYWAAYRGFHQATGVRLYAWLNSARETVGMTREQVRIWWKEQVINRITGGLPFRGSRLDVINEDAKHYREQVIEAVEEGRPPPGEVRNRVAQRLRVAGNVSVVVLIGTIACTVHALHADLEDAEREREILASRMGNLTLSERDQTLDGATEELAVGVVNEEWDGAEQSVFYRQSIGRPLTQEDAEQLVEIPGVSVQQRFASLIEWSDAILFGGPADSIPGVVPAKEEACNIFMKEGVQWTIAGAEVVVSVATAGALRGAGAAVRAALEGVALLGASMGLGELMGTLIESNIKTAAGMDFSGLATGSEKFDENFVSINYISQTGNRNINFGRPMDIEEADEAQSVAVNDIRAQNRNAPFAERYFAIDNPFSLTSRLAAVTPTSATGIASKATSGLASVGSILTSPARIFGSVLGSFSSDKIAQAEVVPAPGTNFGVDQWGWSVEEQERIDTDPSFAIPEVGCNENPNNFVCIVEPRIEELNKRYWDCYNQETFVLQSDRPDKCDKELLSAGHPDFGDDALYWRYYMAYLYVLGRLQEDV